MSEEKLRQYLDSAVMQMQKWKNLQNHNKSEIIPI